MDFLPITEGLIVGLLFSARVSLENKRLFLLSGCSGSAKREFVVFFCSTVDKCRALKLYENNPKYDFDSSFLFSRITNYYVPEVMRLTVCERRIEKSCYKSAKFRKIEAPSVTREVLHLLYETERSEKPPTGNPILRALIYSRYHGILGRF